MVVVAALVAACGRITVTEPPATPTDFPGLTGRLNAVGIEVRDWVSGDAGCDDPDLVPAVIRFSASGIDQARPLTMRLFVFRNRAAFERHRAAVGPCAKAWVTDAATYEEVQQSPYVLAGQGPWAPGFEASLRQVLALAAGTGG
jgi:hypothetical protein